jgi:hypothetical protein
MRNLTVGVRTDFRTKLEGKSGVDPQIETPEFKSFRHGGYRLVLVAGGSPVDKQIGTKIVDGEIDFLMVSRQSVLIKCALQPHGGRAAVPV